jgi:hypothetical protein
MGIKAENLMRQQPPDLLCNEQLGPMLEPETSENNLPVHGVCVMESAGHKRDVCLSVT